MNKPSTTFTKQSRSRMANGSMFLGDVDGRRQGPRRWRDAYASLTESLGGEAFIDPLMVQKCRRAASFIVVLENMETRIAKDSRDLDNGFVDIYIRGVSSLSRVLRSLGLEVAVEPGGQDDLAVLRSFEIGDGSRTQDGALEGFIAAKGMTMNHPAKRSAIARKTLDRG